MKFMQNLWNSIIYEKSPVVYKCHRGRKLSLRGITLTFDSFYFADLQDKDYKK